VAFILRSTIEWPISRGDSRMMQSLLNRVLDFFQRKRRETADVTTRIFKARDRNTPIPELIEALQDEGSWEVSDGSYSDAVAIKAAETLGRIGDSAIPDLAAALRYQRPRIRCGAATALGYIDATDALSLLTQALRDPESSVRASTALALWHKGTAAIPLFKDALDDPDQKVRIAVTNALQFLGSDAVPLLILMLKDADHWVRANAAHALGIIGTEAREAAPALRQAMDSVDRSVYTSVHQFTTALSRITREKG
jgi:HEAT repeat protein